MKRRRRVAIAAGLVLVLGLSLAGQAAVLDPEPRVSLGEDASPGNVLVGAQSWSYDGAIVELTPEGEVAWEWSIPNVSVFAVEQVNETTVLAALAVRTPPSECPEEYLTHGPQDDHCVHNRVVEIDKPTGEIVWEYDWYDEFMAHHEVHDAERLPNGQTAIADMGEHRAFTVARNGTITWEWQAEDHMTPGTPFYAEYGGPEFTSEHQDWTHMNDIDHLENGNFQLSIRNFDVVIEVDPETDEIVSVLGEPGEYDTMYEQHNPQKLEGNGTVIVADSENDRIVELNATTGEPVWRFTGPEGATLQWARDADRLPNGHTIVTDSWNNRILEVDERGEIVWAYEDPGGDVIPIPYEADKVGVGESADGPPGDELESAYEGEFFFEYHVRDVVAVSHYVLPPWMGLTQLLHLLGIVAGVLWLVGEGALVVVLRAASARGR